MDHIAILNPKMATVEDILCGNKTIESRWYKHKIDPWNKVNIGDYVYFKKSGGMIMSKARVSKVLQFKNPTQVDINNIFDKYSDKGKIYLKTTRIGILDYAKDRKYIILIFFKNVMSITPFNINKSGFGISSAWICVDNIDKIKLPLPQRNSCI